MKKSDTLLLDDAGVVENQPFILLLDTLPFPAFVVAADGPAYYNEAFVTYVGFRPGSSYADRTALHHPDEQPVLKAARAAGAKANIDYIVEARLRRFDGEYRWHRIHNKPLFESGRRIAYLGTATDIHDARLLNELLERRVRERTFELEEANRSLVEEEARYRDLYNRTPVALHSCDGSRRIVEVNDTWLDLFGYGRAEIIGRTTDDFMTADSARIYRDKAWPEMLSSNGQVRVVDYEFVNKSGQSFDGRLAARGVFDGAGQLIRTWAATSNISAEKQANRALGQAQRLDAIGQLTAGIAHDFNNLLTAILTNLELLSRPNSADANRQHRLIGGARSAAERGAKLTRQLLAFARQQRIVAEPIDVNAVVEDMRSILWSTLGNDIEITIALEPDLPAAQADATQLQLAVLNLAINARDALVPGGRITIRTSSESVGKPSRPEEPEGGRYVVVAVGDNGSGIDDAVRERIFEPFFTTKSLGHGSGLGLAQVLGIMKQLGGGVNVVTALNEGTTIRLLMPMADVQAATLAGPALEQNTTKKSLNLRILLVDDDADVRSAASTALRDAGHYVVDAESGSIAWDVLVEANGRFDLIVADVVMPGMSGTELATKAQLTWPDLRVLFVTGFADLSKLPAELWGGLLPKPFQPTELEARVAEAMSFTDGRAELRVSGCGPTV